MAGTIRRGAFAHLLVRGVETHHPSADGADQWSGDSDNVTALRVEALREIPAQFDVLALILAHRDEVRVVEKNVRSHEHRIGEDAGVDPLAPLRLAPCFELGHPVEPAHRCERLEDPAQLRVSGDVRLYEDLAPGWVETARDIHSRQLQGQRAQTRWIGVTRQCVQVDDAEVVLVAVLIPGPVAQRTEVVADVKPEVRLDAAQDAGAWGSGL